MQRLPLDLLSNIQGRNEPILSSGQRSSGETASIDRCRALLGSDGDGLNDEEIDELRRHADAMAHILIDLFVNAGQRTTRDA